MRKIKNLMVFYVDVGNVLNDDVAKYMEEVKTQLGPKPSYVDDQYFIPIRGNGTPYGTTRIEKLTFEVDE